MAGQGLSMSASSSPPARGASVSGLMRCLNTGYVVRFNRYSDEITCALNLRC
jgi:hypothetical protein